MKTVIRNPNGWRKRTASKRCRRLELVFAGIALFRLVSGLAAELQTTLSPKQTEFCYSAECNRTASEVLSKMNNKIKPCDDFYQFACGEFIEKTQIPENKLFVTAFLKLSDQVEEQLQDIIKEQRPETDPKFSRLPNDLYTACLNTTLIETLGPEPIQRIARKLGGWPVTNCDCWDDASWTWQETVKKSRQFGLPINNIVSFLVKEDSSNTSKRIITLDQPTLGIDLGFLTKGFTEPSVSIYYDYMVDMAVLFGANNATARMELRKCLQFEMNLAKISLPFSKRLRSNDLYNVRTIKQLQKDYPYVQWLDYINALLPDGLTVDENEMINVAVPSFFEELGELLNRTEIRDIANYLMWRIHEYSVQFLSEKFRSRQLQFHSESWFPFELEPRSKVCAASVLASLAIPLNSLYVRKHLGQSSRREALEMFNNIRNAFSRILNETHWMDDNAKQEAKKKLHLITTYIGYHDELLDDNKLTKYYQKLKINPVKYLISSLRKNAFDTDNLFNELRSPVNELNWINDRPAVVNGFYSDEGNSINLPAGILQGHIFKSDRLKCMNYGAIGQIIGHEIIRGFNDEGSLYGGDGSSFDWWQNSTRNAYMEKVQCVIDQYGNYTDKQTGLNLNGHNIQHENIADNGGIRTAYLAYQQLVAQNGEEPRLPGLNYTSQQMFWISVAQVWCAKYKKSYAVSKIVYSTHPLDEFRVLGPLSNMEEFSRDFQCANGTRMNPVKKCKVW